MARTVVLLVHQGHGLAHQGHRLLDQLLQQIIDVDDFLRFLLLGFAVEIRSWTALSTISSLEMS